METEWIGYLNVIALDKPIGNMLAGLIDPDVGGSQTFDKGIALREIGSQSTTPTAWAASSPLRQAGLEYCGEFASDGPYPLLNELGLTNEQIAVAKPAMLMEFGSRAQYEGRLLAFITEQGYEIIPQG